MKQYLAKLILISTGVLMISCSTFNSYEYQLENEVRLVDSLATKKTVSLFFNLKEIQKTQTIFGHQLTSALGHDWEHDGHRSDVKDVTGSFPGLYGWDITNVVNPWPLKIRTYTRLIKEAYDRGGINAFCWHYNNPVTGNNFYDTTVAVKHIIPGGSHHQIYKKDLDRIAEFANTLIADDGKLIPIIFRPFHEFDGNWFWWGKPFTTKEEFIQLWRFTVEYLRDEKKVRNIIYAFSPDRYFYSEEEYLERYPGDKYVDIVAMDDYGDFKSNGAGIDVIIKKLSIVSKLAEKKNKIAALTETGIKSIPDSVWWTDKLLPIIKNESVKIAFVMVWSNSNHRKKHFYAPYPGHKSADDFIKFKEDPHTIFQDNLPNPYIIQRRKLSL
jgi:mannan endo-1,4-beta-mannosidase